MTELWGLEIMQRCMIRKPPTFPALYLAQNDLGFTNQMHGFSEVYGTPPSGIFEKNVFPGML